MTVSMSHVTGSIKYVYKCLKTIKTFQSSNADHILMSQDSSQTSFPKASSYLTQTDIME